MQTFAAGADWMLERWRELLRVLEDERFWHYDQRYHVTKLLGKRPEDVMNDVTGRDLLLAANALHPQAWSVFDEVMQATMGAEGRPSYYYRIDTMELTAWPSQEEAYAYLHGLACDEIARLEDLKARHLDPQAAADRAGAPLRALSEPDEGSDCRRRYEAQLDRTLRSSVETLLKARKQSGDGPFVARPVDLGPGVFPGEASPAASAPGVFVPEPPPGADAAGLAPEGPPPGVYDPAADRLTPPLTASCFGVFARRVLRNEPERYAPHRPAEGWQPAEIIPDDPPAWAVETPA